MSGHVLDASFPLFYVEVGVVEPAISIYIWEAPHCLGDMVVEVDIDLLLEAFCSYGIKDYRKLAKLHFCWKWGLYLQPCNLWGERGIILHNFTEDFTIIDTSALWKAVWIETSPSPARISSIISMAYVKRIMFIPRLWFWTQSTGLTHIAIPQEPRHLQHLAVYTSICHMVTVGVDNVTALMYRRDHMVMIKPALYKWGV